MVLQKILKIIIVVLFLFEREIMSLAIQNFTFLMRNLPLVMLYSGGMAAEKTLFNLFKTDSSHSLWEKAEPGARIAAIFVAIYSISATLEQYVRKTHVYSNLLFAPNLVQMLYVFPLIYDRIDRDLLGDSRDGWSVKIKNCAHNISAVMISALVAAIGIIVFKTISATYLGENLNARALSLTSI